LPQAVRATATRAATRIDLFMGISLSTRRESAAETDGLATDHLPLYQFK
jgi:hypothetical protein